jgi:hypothetical protein
MNQNKVHGIRKEEIKNIIGEKRTYNVSFVAL